jgi:transcriptional regulator with XRE-family HTH domain
MPTLRQKFGANLRLIRHQRKLTQEEFSELVGISVDFLSLIERGVSAPSFEVLEGMAGALKLPVKDLFDFKRVPSKLPRHVQR